ncbi:DUF2244 domain-containing protein [Sandaracinobacteroides saxicola]|uniref:DUF2244 domain-containing protein n=1 Tax=Sandaracinobacteroides saxicola TaxID=2759707 RepID=A0A7G5IL75_9SPHN|nr:DUF2244 domain-containing protein [Sandaracinobacteroides saxicola]QMW24117.1 DUF2244 domain-containing protein [Sandaracinobacteroides saxicola]
MADGKAYFDLELRPNRSMEPRLFRWTVLGVGLLFALMALRFLVLGAWPVLPFLLADVALLAWAMRASYRSGRAVEYVRLSDERLTVRRVSAAGRERRVQLEPFWTRVELEVLDERQNRLWLRTRERRVSVGAFLSPPERVALADVIGEGLARFRAGCRAGDPRG